MQARGLLMIEHRVIDRMIAVMADRVELIWRAGDFDPHFVDVAVDFIGTYADRTHHGKEEAILFRDLGIRPLPGELRRQMDRLIEEHQWARETTIHLVGANKRYRNGDPSALSDIAETMQALVEFYPDHMRREDTSFFPAARALFSDAEDQVMLQEFWDFDRGMIHEKYRAVVADLASI